MPKDESFYRNINKAPVRTTKEIKAGLLRRAFDGESKRSAPELIAMIQAACTRAATMPEGHAEILADINNPYAGDEPRSVLMLNALARLIEAQSAEPMIPVRFRYNPDGTQKRQNAPGSPSLQ